MALTRAAGKHRRPTRLDRSRSHLARIALLAGSGTVATFAAPAAPAVAAGHDAPAGQTGLRQALVIGDTLAEAIDDQARAQQEAAEAEAKAEAEARAKAKKEREARERAAREAERRRLNTYVLPVQNSSISTPYRASSGLWSSGAHTGIDFHAAAGTTVRAVGAGTVVEAGWAGAYGENVVIKMSDGTYTQYGHLSAVNVSVGQIVTPGQRIGLSGSTGNTTGPHLHFEVRTTPEYGSDIDPVAYLRSHGLSL